MADTVHVPGIKEPLPKWAVFGGVAAVVVLVIMYYRSKSSSAAAAPASPAAAAPPIGGTTGSDPYPWDGTYGNPSDPNSMDPSTGMTYGDEGTSGYGLGGGYASGAGGGGAGATGSAGVSGPPFSTNAQWSAYVIPQLEANDPTLNPTDVQNAIGEYLAGQPLSAPYRTIVFDAEAVGGQPPVPGPNGYPPKLMGNGGKGGGGGSGGGSGSGSGGSGSGTVTVPDVMHQLKATAQANIRAAGLQVRTTQGHDGHVTWQHPAGGAKAARGSIVDIHVH